MKKRYILLIPLVLTVVSCNTSSPEATVSHSNGNITHSETITHSDKFSHTETTNIHDNTDASEDEIPEYTSISIASADFTTRKISSKEDVTYEDLFNLGNKVDISIEMEESELEKLQADYATGYKSDIYRHCKVVTITLKNYDNTFTWEYQDVGIRQKGNTSRSKVYENGKLSGLNHFKLSFDETFDDTEAYGADAYSWDGKQKEYEERSDREFLGLSGLDIKWNKNYDSTHIREVYASKIYEAAGILSQKVGLTTFGITVGSTSYSMGLCTLYEQATKSMIKRHLKDKEILSFGTWKEEKNGSYGVADSSYGDLYKASYGVGKGYSEGGARLDSASVRGTRVGVGDLYGTYIPAYERKTNKDVDYDDAPLRALGAAVNSKNYASIRKLMDLEYFAATEACNYFIGNPDDFRNNNNNYMIYIRRTDGKAVTIPIDNDRCFGITKDWNPGNQGMTNIKPYSTEKAKGGSVNALFSTTILSSGTNASKKIYTEYLKALKLSDWCKSSTFEAYYQMAYTTYNGYQNSSFGTFAFALKDSMNQYSFQEYMDIKKSYIDVEGEEKEEENEQTQDKGNYGDVYLAGSFNGWNSINYKMTYNGNGEYTITFTPNNVSNGAIEFKFNNGTGWDKINWTIENNTLVMESKGNAKLEGVTTSSVITITINTLTKEVTITK